MVSTGEVRGFHLMIRAISLATEVACAVMDCINFKEQKPESARTSKGEDKGVQIHWGVATLQHTESTAADPVHV